MGISLSLIGFGEAGQTFALAGGWGAAARAYDKLTDGLETRSAKQDEYAVAGVQGVSTPAAAVKDSPIVLSLVTANESLNAARSVAPALARGALFFDFNSVAPQTKVEAAGIIETAGGCYVDVAIMAPVKPHGLGVPLLVSGTAAAEGAVALRQLGFAPTIIEGQIGRASTVKMLRSIMVKGIEALTAECFLAAVDEGVAEEVAASLDKGEFQYNWLDRTAYNLERMRTHGLRRAAEMDQAAKTIEALGRDPVMTRAAATVQRNVAEAAKQCALTAAT
jgi:3-hydroxyisobutyrate dehydrogenase-like beta-hydroxyacid dehydrogenase